MVAEVPTIEMEAAEKEEALASALLMAIAAESVREREVGGSRSWGKEGFKAQGVSLQSLPLEGGMAEEGTAERSRTSASPLNETTPLHESRPFPHSYPSPGVSLTRSVKEGVHNGAYFDQENTHRNGEQAEEDAVMTRDHEAGRQSRDELEGRGRPEKGPHRGGMDVRDAIDSEWEEASERERERERLERRREWER